MKIYLAGAPGIKSRERERERERERQKILHNRLLSFWDIIQDQFNVPFAFKLIKKESKMNLFLAGVPGGGSMGACKRES